jgi:hypothetical protein
VWNYPGLRLVGTTADPQRRASRRLAVGRQGRSFNAMICRDGCGACCIAPSITSPLPGMPHGKPAGIPCVNLTDDYRCALFGRPERPAFCSGLRPEETMCGRNRDDAMEHLSLLERATRP